MNRILLSLLLLSVWRVGVGGAQEIRVEGRVDHPSVVAVLDVLARNQYTLIDRDTLLEASSSIQGDVVIASATVRLEGRVGGTAVILPGGELFLRPGSVVAGPAVEIKGGLYPSQRASMGERLSLPAEVDAVLERIGQAYVLRLTPPARPAVVRATGIFGLGVPTYDRVNALTLRAGGRVRISADSAAPILAVSALYHTARERFGGEATLTVPLTDRLTLIGEAARRTETNDRWIRGDLANSLSSVFIRSDMRDYYEADLAQVEIARSYPSRQAVSRVYLAPSLGAGVSRSRSVSEADPWALFGGSWRENPAIDPGIIASATVGTGVRWRGLTSSIAGDAALEWAPATVGDFEFRLLTVDGRWTMRALADHTIRIRTHLVHPLGSSAPRQRWSILGGPGTLPTLEAGDLRGDHLVFIESTYAVPLTPITIPFIGSPSLVGRHAIGSAWASESATPPLDQNIGLALAFPLVSAGVDVDPTDPGDPVLSVGVTLPF